MNRKAVAFLVMVGIIVMLLVVNIYIFKDYEEEIVTVDNKEQTFFNVENETAITNVDKEKQELPSFHITVLGGEAASSLSSELATASDVQHVIFGETYYESDELEIEGESESESESVAR